MTFAKCTEDASGNESVPVVHRNGTVACYHKNASHSACLDALDVKVDRHPWLQLEHGDRKLKERKKPPLVERWQRLHHARVQITLLDVKVLRPDDDFEDKA